MDCCRNRSRSLCSGGLEASPGRVPCSQMDSQVRLRTRRRRWYRLIPSYLAVFAYTYRLIANGSTVAKGESAWISARPDIKRQKRRRQVIGAVIGVVLLGIVTIGVSRLKPAAQGVERSTVWTDTVKRGPMLRQVRDLVADSQQEFTRQIPAETKQLSSAFACCRVPR